MSGAFPREARPEHSSSYRFGPEAVGRHRPAGRSGGLDHGFADVEALEVVGAAYQRPFQRRFRQASQQEAAEAERGFDDAEDGFDGLLALLVERAAGGGGGAVGEPLESQGEGQALGFNI